MDYAVFEEGILERLGVTCSGCGITVIYDLSAELPAKKIVCSCCGRVLLDVMNTCIEPDGRFPRQFSWLTLYKWLQTQAKENTIRFYFPRGHRRLHQVPDKVSQELCQASDR